MENNNEKEENVQTIVEDMNQKFPEMTVSIRYSHYPVYHIKKLFSFFRHITRYNSASMRIAFKTIHHTAAIIKKIEIDP